MQNQNGEHNIINKELLPLIDYAKWELYHFNLSTKIHDTPLRKKDLPHFTPI